MFHVEQYCHWCQGGKVPLCPREPLEPRRKGAIVSNDPLVHCCQGAKMPLLPRWKGS